MALEERIRAAVLPIVPVCEPNVDPGEAEEYCTFNFDEQPEMSGDDAPQAIRYLCQLHYFLPKGRRPTATKKDLCRALLAAGFTYPAVVNASDDVSQHYVFEFQDVVGVCRDG